MFNSSRASDDDDDFTEQMTYRLPPLPFLFMRVIRDEIHRAISEWVRGENDDEAGPCSIETDL